MFVINVLCFFLLTNIWLNIGIPQGMKDPLRDLPEEPLD